MKIVLLDERIIRMLLYSYVVMLCDVYRQTVNLTNSLSAADLVVGNANDPYIYIQRNSDRHRVDYVFIMVPFFSRVRRKGRQLA